MSAYVLGILCAGMLCAIAGAVGSAGQGTRRLIGGIFLALAVLKPLGAMELPKLDLDEIRQASADAVRSGTEQAERARTEVISEGYRSYILSKAAEAGIQAEVDVELDDDDLPKKVKLTLSASPSEREWLLTWICRDLGVEREAVEWNERYQSCE